MLRKLNKLNTNKMANQNYDPNKMGGRLIIKLNPGEKFYVIASPDTQPGHYTQIEEKSATEQSSIHNVIGHRSLVVLREELIERCGGLNEVVRQIKAGTFQLRRGEQQ